MSADDQLTPNTPEDDEETFPPRIVAETPLGGVVKPDVAKPDAAKPEAVKPGDPLASESAPPDAESPVEAPDPDHETTLADAGAAELASHMQRAMEADQPALLVSPVSPVSPASPPSTIKVEETDEDTQEWDDDLSPELASVLFATKPRAAKSPESAADQPPEPVTPAVPAVPAAPVVTAAAPIQLTSKESARHLAITAEGHAAPAPESPLSAKVRYVRIEEPLKDDKGQRFEETWTYFKGEYPALAGRLVREVSTEETRYADGSWKWTYERRYEDRGRDSREVRANAAGTYVEREDVVSVINAEGKRSQYDEDAALILAPPESDEKRGGLLSSLFGRDKDDDDTGSGAAVWREATSSETRQARRDGADAFDRSLFERLF